jgi:signal transduction histidine kinase
LSRTPLNIDTDEEIVAAEKISALNKLAENSRTTDVRSGLKAARDAVILSMGLKPEDNIYDAISKISLADIPEKKLFALSLIQLAWYEVEYSKFDDAITGLLLAKKILTDFNDKYFLCKVAVILGSVYVLKGEFQTALDYNLEGLKFAEEDKNAENIMILCSNTGLTYWNLGETTKAYEFISRSLKYKRQRGDKLDIAKSLNNLGLVYNSMGDYLKALECYQEAFSIVEAHGETKGMGILSMNLGLLYERLGERDKAVLFMYKAFDAYKKANYKKGLGECLVNIALIKRVMGDLDSALKIAYESYTLSAEIGDKKVIAFAYQEIMQVHKARKEYKQALKFALKCYELRKEIEHKAGVMEICGSIGEILTAMNETEKALVFLQEGIKIGIAGEFNAEMLNLYTDVSQCYEAAGDYKSAVVYLKKHNELRDKVFSEESQKRIRSVQAQFEVEQAQRESEIYKLKNIDLADANKKLEMMNQEKNEFLNLVSHDLKNPLNSIYGFSNLLVEDINTLSMEEITDFASNINISSMAMLDLINEILNSELMDSGRYELHNELIDLNVMVKALISMNKFQLRQKDIKIEFDEKVIAHVFSDANIVKQIISNLLSNAIKFSPDGKKIFINIWHNKIDSSTLVSIKDEGPGLTEEDKNKLFVKFARLSAKPTGGESSTGLGLSIVKKLTDIISGKIMCESTPGQGAKFVLQIPTTPISTKNNHIH